MKFFMKILEFNLSQLLSKANYSSNHTARVHHTWTQSTAEYMSYIKITHAYSFLTGCTGIRTFPRTIPPDFPPGWIALYKLKQVSKIQLLFRDRTISINPASIWTKKVFHQILGSFWSISGLFSSFFYVFATQQSFLSPVQLLVNNELFHQSSFYLEDIVLSFQLLFQQRYLHFLRGESPGRNVLCSYHPRRPVWDIRTQEYEITMHHLEQ